MLSLLFITLVIGFAAAQNSSAEYNSTYILPSSVDLSTRGITLTPNRIYPPSLTISQHHGAPAKQPPAPCSVAAKFQRTRVPL